MDDLNLTFALIVQLQLDDIDELRWRRSYEEGYDAALVACSQNLRHAFEQWQISRNGDHEDIQEISSPTMESANEDLQSSDAPLSRTSAIDQSMTISRVTCDICLQDRHSFDILRAPCSHKWCRHCIVERLEASLEDESSFPPRCCQEVIPVSSAIDFV